MAFSFWRKWRNVDSVCGARSASAPIHLSLKGKNRENVLLHILPKWQWILAFDTAFERSQYPPKSTFNTYLPGMRPLVRAAFQSSEVWCAAFFRLPWENLNFSLTIRPSVKTLEDITDNGHKQNIYLILISLRCCIWSWRPCKVSLHLPSPYT